MIAEAGKVWRALHVSHFLVSASQFALERGVAATLARQNVQVFDPSFHHQLTGRHGAGQVLDRVVKFEQIRVRKASYIVKSLVGQPRFPGGCGDTGKKRKYD